MKTELHNNMPENDYFAVDAASNSTLGRMKKSAAHCKEYLDTGMEPTPAMKLGKLVHCLVLEPDQFANRYHVADQNDPSTPRKQVVADAIQAYISDDFNGKFFVDEGNAPREPTGKALDVAEILISGGNIEKHIVEPAMNKRTTEGKAKFGQFQDRCEREGLTVVKQQHIDDGVMYADYILQVAGRIVIRHQDNIVAKNYADYLGFIDGKIVVSPDNYEQAKKIAASVRSHPAASKLLQEGDAEVSMFWTDPDTGYPCKARVDFLNNLGYMVDLKTTQDASEAEFGRSIGKFGYHRQDGMYMDGYEAVTGERAKGFVFIAVETKAPYAVGVYLLDEDSELKGRTEYKELLVDFVACKKSGVWPGYSDAVRTIELPKWYK